MIGIFGSAFNPPTLGHAQVIKGALQSMDKVIAVPSYDHCFGKRMAPYEVRVKLARALVSDMGEERVVVSEIERKIWAGGPVSSLSVLRALRDRLNDELCLIIGPDNAERFHEFRNHEQIRQEFQVFVAQDAGECFPRSTQIRQIISEGGLPEHGVSSGVLAQLKHDYKHFQGI